jgi:hypothetical protein
MSSWWSRLIPVLVIFALAVAFQVMFADEVSEPKSAERRRKSRLWQLRFILVFSIVILVLRLRRV